MKLYTPLVSGYLVGLDETRKEGHYLAIALEGDAVKLRLHQMPDRDSFAIILAGVGALAALACVSSTAEAVTQFQKSLFTSVDRKACQIVHQHPDGNAYLCQGLPGYPIYLAEGDGRTFIASSSAPENSAAATQTLKAFNTPFLHHGERATVEWRFTIKDKRQVPFAMIVRYFTELDGAKGEVLVVSRIAGKEACHVGYIDALANSDAIVLARRIADERARSFNCREAATVEGVRGQSPM